VLVAEGIVDAVLTARITHPQLDNDYPGCLSRKVIDASCGVSSASTASSSPMPGDARHLDVFGFERGTILAVNAGVDLLLFCNESGMVPYDDERGPAAVR